MKQIIFYKLLNNEKCLSSSFEKKQFSEINLVQGFKLVVL